MRRLSDSVKANVCQAQQRDLKTIAPLSHRPIVLTDTIDYRTIVFCTIVLTPVFLSWFREQRWKGGVVLYCIWHPSVCMFLTAHQHSKNV